MNERENPMAKNLIAKTLFVSIVILLSACGSQSSIQVTDVWARPGLQEGNTGVFFIIDNPASTEDRLLSAQSSIAAIVELHKTEMKDDVMQMIKQDYVDIPANGQVIFKPGDLHVMLIDLSSPLNVGDTFEITLVFEHSGEITLEVPVQEP
jgi:copper(I)-binding protein